MNVVDVGALPKHGFGHKHPLWWAVMALIVVEGTMLALLAVSYFYVRDRTAPFPPVTTNRLAAWVATIEVGAWLVSAWPMVLATKAARAGSVRGVRTNLIIATLLGIIAVTLRWYEFHLLPFGWDHHAYGSMVWALLGVQWLHGFTGIGENVLFIALFFKRPVEDKHRVDVDATAPLWYFVIAGAVLAWAVVFVEVLV